MSRGENEKIKLLQEEFSLKTCTGKDKKRDP
jgi:hypothetical protein